MVRQADVKNADGRRWHIVTCAHIKYSASILCGRRHVLSQPVDGNSLVKVDCIRVGGTPKANVYISCKYQCNGES